MIKTINKIKESILDFRLGDALAELDEIINAHVDWGLGDELNSLAELGLDLIDHEGILGV